MVIQALFKNGSIAVYGDVYEYKDEKGYLYLKSLSCGNQKVSLDTVESYSENK